MKHHLHVAPRFAQIVVVQSANVAPADPDLTRLRLYQAQDGPAATGFAAAAFADQGQGFADIQGETDILDRVDLRHRTAQDATFDRKAGGQVADVQQHLGLADGGFGGSRRCAGRFIAADPHPFGGSFARHFAQLWHGSQQRLGVILLGVFKDFGDGPGFHNPPTIHHDHAVSHLRHHRHVMGDEQHGHALFALQAIDQGQNFRLNRDIKCGCRLIRDQQPRFTGHRHRDHHALAHAA